MTIRFARRAAIMFAVVTSGLPLAAQERIALGSTNAQSSHYAYFAALAGLLNDKTDLQASVVETGATVDNLRRMERGQLDAGLITTSALYQAYNGLGEFEGAPIQSQLLWAYSLAPQLIIVRQDAGLDAIEDLDGMRFGPGQRGSSTEATSEQVMGVFGLTPEWVRGSNSELANEIKDDRLAGFIKSAVGTKFDPLTTDIATLTPLKVLPISREQADMIQAELPELSIVEQPADPQQGADAPYLAWGFMIGVGARPDLPEEVAYQMTKAAIEDTLIQQAAFADLKGNSIPELTLAYATSPLHPGAIRAYEEAGFEVPAKLKPE